MGSDCKFKYHGWNYSLSKLYSDRRDLKLCINDRDYKIISSGGGGGGAISTAPMEYSLEI